MGHSLCSGAVRDSYDLNITVFQIFYRFLKTYTLRFDKMRTPEHRMDRTSELVFHCIEHIPHPGVRTPEQDYQALRGIQSDKHFIGEIIRDEPSGVFRTNRGLTTSSG